MKSVIKVFISGVALMMASTTIVAQTEVKKDYVCEKIQLVSAPSNIEGETADMLVDRHYYTKWCYDQPEDMPYTVIVSTEKPIKLAQYGLATAEDTSNYPVRNPMDWRVWGSNDQKKWTKLDEKKFNWTMRGENELEYTFKVKDAESFRFYKFEFVKMQGGTRIQLSEINLYR